LFRLGGYPLGVAFLLVLVSTYPNDERGRIRVSTFQRGPTKEGLTKEAFFWFDLTNGGQIKEAYQREPPNK